MALFFSQSQACVWYDWFLSDSDPDPTVVAHFEELFLEVRHQSMIFNKTDPFPPMYIKGWSRALLVCREVGLSLAPCILLPGVQRLVSGEVTFWVLVIPDLPIYNVLFNFINYFYPKMC